MGWFDEINGGDLIQAQVAPRQQPQPWVRPGEEQQRAAPRAPAMGMPAQQSQPKSWFDDINGLPQQAEAPKPENTFAEPDAPTWMGRGVQMIRGKQDPRFKDVQTYSEPHESASGAGALLSGADDHGIADVLKKELGDRFIKSYNDANGYPIIEYMGQDGQSKREYVNKPGLDAADAMRGVIGAVPYVLGGSVVGSVTKKLGMLGQALSQGVGAGATNLAAQGGRQMAGSEQGFNPAETAITAIAGAGAQVLAPAAKAVWSKFVTEPRLFNKAAGALTPEGEAAARASGLDPSTLTQEIQKEFAQEYARTGSTALGSTLATKEFGVPVTRGQVTKDPGQLLTEKAMRANVYGERAKDTIQEFDRRQALAIEDAARGDSSKSIAARINPTTPAAGARPGELGQSIRSKLQEANQAASASENEAWKATGTLTPKKEALDELPAIVGGKVGPLRVDPKLTPAAQAMAEDLDGFISGAVPGEGPKVLNRVPVQDVDGMRRRLLATMKGAENDTDRVAAKAIYDGYNEWIGKAAEKSLLNGDPAGAAALRTARDITKEMKSIFGETNNQGMSTPGRKIFQSILNDADTPEAVVAKLFSVNPGSVSKAGAQEAIGLIKTGLEKYAAPETATAAWNDIRLAAWKRIIEDNSGRLHTPTMLAKQIDQSFNAQGSLMRQLFTSEELGLIRRFGKAMKDVAYKDPNPSGSGVAAAFYAGQFGQAFMKLMGMSNGPIARIFQTIIGSTPIKNAVGGVAAQGATNPAIATQLPVLGPYGASAYSAAEQAAQSKKGSSPLAGLVQ